MPEQSTKKQRTHPQYELLYHPGAPGRGEYIRLPLEAAGVSYTDLSNERKDGHATALSYCDPSHISDPDGNPPVFAVPALRIPGAGAADGKALVLHQTPAILAYLGPKIGMVPEDEAGAMHVSQIALTALDCQNEAHDTHHPVGVGLYYEDQKPEGLRRATDFRESRIPKYFSYFERILRWNEGRGRGRYFVGEKLTYADTTVWQVLDGMYFAFPKEMKARQSEFPLLLGIFYAEFKEEKGIKEYLSSKRRLPYSKGIFRHYPELDRQ